QEAARESASALYDQMLDELRGNKSAGRASGEKLIAEYASTPYAAMAALIVAREAQEAGDKTLARERLQWALAHAKEAATQHAARLRLARLSLDSGDAAAAAALVDVKEFGGFEAEYQELKGDIAQMQGKPSEARSAYGAALKQISAGSPYAAVITMKLADLGPEKQ